MADRFPSIEEFSAGQTEPKLDSATSADNFDLDPASTAGADFLDREKAALGDDADRFATPNDNSFAAASTTGLEGDADNDLLGGGVGGGDEQQLDIGSFPDAGVAQFESSFPVIDTGNEQVAPGGTITGPTEPYLPGHGSYGAAVEDEEEPEVIKQWRERRDLALQHRDEVSATRKEETVKAAQTAIDDFYENYNNKKEKTLAQTRKEAEEFLNSREDTSAGGTSWERIAKLVDLSGKGTRGGASGTGKERFRELLLNLRKDEKAPGASGY
ncbi:clathrin light chain [Xylona heveae TC161]|uniref:Clathrin light chain n=1 Tax=Xylona heveae (strain CBS 132557 / TC161) TaxID=1328760 RepID=A0A165G4B4_XYLHT|nr:clathrin light chain [Xylona heveae TC161]KZF21723.1 clathrin light chain [Xylona heveae TC161]